MRWQAAAEQSGDDQVIINSSRCCSTWQPFDMTGGGTQRSWRQSKTERTNEQLSPRQRCHLYIFQGDNLKSTPVCWKLHFIHTYIHTILTCRSDNDLNNCHILLSLIVHFLILKMKMAWFCLSINSNRSSNLTLQSIHPDLPACTLSHLNSSLAAIINHYGYLRGHLGHLQIRMMMSYMT